MTHPLAALIAGVTRFNIKTGEHTDPSVLLLEAEVLAALEAATPPATEKGGDAIDGNGSKPSAKSPGVTAGAVPPDLVEAGKVLEKTVNTCIDLSDQNMGVEARAVGSAADTIRALIALATAQAAQIAGLQDKLEFVQRREIASNTKFDERWSEAQAAAATLQAEVERLRGALERIDQWADAYPLEVFAEPDFAKADEVLKTAGLSLSAISASNMRHVIEGVKAIFRALEQEGRG